MDGINMSFHGDKNKYNFYVLRDIDLKT